MEASETAKKAFEALTAATRATFPQHKIRAISEAVDWDKLRAWVLQRVAILRPGQDEQQVAARLADELCWSFIDLQIALCHVLFVYDTGDVHPGMDEVQVNTIDLPQLKTPDALFLFYVSVAWEQVYRVWSRYENILRYAFFGEAGKPSKDSRFDLDGILERVATERPAVAAMPEYMDLKRLVSERQAVSGRRNRASHGESSPFHAVLQQDITVSELFQPSGLPNFNLNIKYPAPDEAIRALIDAYIKTDTPWGTTVLKFLDAASRDRGAASETRLK